METKSIGIAIYAEHDQTGCGPLNCVWGRPLLDYPLLNVFEFIKEKNLSADYVVIGDQKVADYLKENHKLKVEVIPAQSLRDYFQGKIIEISLSNILLTYDELQAGNIASTPFDLEDVSNVLGTRIKKNLRDQGVHFIDSRHSYIDSTVEVQKGTTIYPNCHIKGPTKIGKNVVIEPGVIIDNSIIENDVTIKAYSYIENSHIKSKASIGPFARIRPNVEIGEESKIGNFVEIKKSKLDKGVKISHLSYVGDAFIGEDTNIGCGFITCNYDGKNKHITKIGKRTFVGSDSQTVAPVEIGDDCFVASGTTVTHSMPDESFAISRGKQITKEKMARKFLK